MLYNVDQALITHIRSSKNCSIHKLLCIVLYFHGPNSVIFVQFLNQ